MMQVQFFLLASSIELYIYSNTILIDVLFIFLFMIVFITLHVRKL